jgi:hypothetical protein
MRKMLLLAATSFFLDFGVTAAEADPLRDRDAAVQREMAGQRSPQSQRSRVPTDVKSDANRVGGGLSLAPGFVTPYGYPLPPYADGDNFQNIYTGR